MKKNKTSYSLVDNLKFMFEKSLRVNKTVLILCLVLPLVSLCLELARFFFMPKILKAIESGLDLRAIMLLILKFTIFISLIGAIKAYMETNTLIGRIEVRTHLLYLINKKQASTSYPNLYKSDFQNLFKRAGETISNNQAPGEAIWQSISDLLQAGLGILVYIYLMKELDYRLIAFIVATAIISFMVTKELNEYGYKNKDELGRAFKESHYILDKFSHIDYAKEIRIFNMIPWLNELYQKSYKLIYSLIDQEEAIYFRGRLIDLFIVGLRNFLAYSYIVSLGLKNQLTISGFVLTFNLITSFSTSLTNFLNYGNQLYKESLEISILRDFLDYEEVFNLREGLDLDIENRGYTIELDNISFKYPDRDDYILENIKLKIRPGERLALVGLNGSGKTTMIKLIMGLLEPSSGRILIDQRDIRDYKREEVYKLFTGVFQDSSILAASIYENVAQLRHGQIHWQRMDQALELSGLKETLTGLEKGGETKLLKTVYLDGIELSGGQYQKLLLARSLYKNSPVLILDEPTSALDPIAENEIYLKYDSITRNNTSIFISHRLASTRFCDRIVFLGKKRILEEGSHQELLDKNGYYAKLYRLQSRYYQEGGEDYEEEFRQLYSFN